MELQTIQEKVMSCVSEVLNVPASEIQAETRLIEDLGANSFAIAEIFLALQTEFGITLEENFMLGRSVSVQDMTALMQQKVNG